MEVALRHRFQNRNDRRDDSRNDDIFYLFEAEASQLEKIAQQCSVSIRGLQGISCYPPVTDQFSILIYTTDDIRISYIKSKKHVHLLQVNGA